MAKDGTKRGGARPGAGRKKKNPDGTFAHSTFTAEQLKELTDSPYVTYVSSKTVSYTKAFKDMAWQRYCDGIDPLQAHGPRAVLLTDITYIPRYSHHSGGSKKFSYVCVIMDAYTKEVLACVCSISCETDFVLEAINQLMKNHASELKTDVLIHSDQGCQYTSTKFVTLLNDVGLRQSMSRRGNCWDNAPQESLFGHMKDEIHVNGTDGHQTIERKVLDWIDYYNYERYQWSLAKLSPIEYYQYTTTGEYPLLISPPKDS